MSMAKAFFLVNILITMNCTVEIVIPGTDCSVIVPTSVKELFPSAQEAITSDWNKTCQ